MRTVHLAEILAADADDARPTLPGHAAVPGRRRRPRSPTSSCATTSAAPPPRSATNALRAVAELPDWEALRHAGAADQGRRPGPAAGTPRSSWRRNVVAAGGIVHWARDAAEANAIVADDRPGATRSREVVKVKSMATQEIELNAALEAAGIDAWETDLAELIVQLGHDLPSHILVPAIHRNRTEIRDIFAARDGRGRPARARRPHRRTGRARRGRPAAPAGEVPAGRDGGLRRQLRGRRDRHRAWSSSPRATAGCA